ncbi:glyoxylase-like metal-dependent hydrolase (beta-lactamase superfamily II) [Mycobacterium sp. MAA66]|uniref:MBL fold metallo-hydrolase n=1 Tax=Mycobacterium sp. MAA66 TaxID=3156297 RepID=UPI003519BFE8
MHKFTVGDATVTQLTELDVWPIPPRLWYPEISDDQLAFTRATYQPSAITADGNTLLFAIHNYVVELDGSVIVVDTCSGNHKNRPYFPDLHMLDTDYPIRLRRAGFEPSDVDIVINTHLHADHCGWNTELVQGTWQPTFPNATYLFHSPELEYIEQQWRSAAVGQWREDAGWVYQDSVRPVLEYAEYRVIAANEQLLASESTRLTVIDAAGHTPGHLAVEITGPHDGLLIVGDALHHPMQAQFPDLPFFADTDPHQGAATRRALLGHAADNEISIVTAHFPVQDPFRVGRRGDSFQWINYPLSVPR